MCVCRVVESAGGQAKCRGIGLQSAAGRGSGSKTAGGFGGGEGGGLMGYGAFFGLLDAIRELI